MDGRTDGTRLKCFPRFLGLQAQTIGGVFINARPSAGNHYTAPFDVLLTLRRFFYLEETQFLSRKSLLADTIVLRPHQVRSPWY
jgi:hypothetical protein